MKKMRKRLGRAKLAKRRTQLAVIAAALGFASWSVWGGANVGNVGGVGNVGAVATARETSGTNRQIVPEPKDGKLESPTGLKAFIVGADDYRDATDLPCVRNDVEAFAARLIEVGFEEKNVAVLKTGGKFDDFPTKANVEERFEAFVENLRPGDFVVVYLSGHGVQPTDSKEAFFVPVDAKAEDPFGTSVSIDRMLAALDASQARFRWMIVDACRNDPTNARGIFKTRATGARGLSEIADAPKTTSLLQSCQPGKCSYEGGDGVANGVFTLSLLEAFDPKNSRADVDGDGALAFSEVLKYVSERTNELALELHGVSQKPTLSGEITDFAILDGLRVGPSGGGSGGAGGGSGWLPFALLTLTGGAAGVAYWAGVRRRIPTRETVGASQYEATLEKWRRAKEEAERRLREAEEAERKVKEDAEEAKRRAKAETEEKERRARAEAEEAERKAAEAERRAREAKEEAERKAKEEAARQASAATAASFASNVGDAEYQAGTRTTLSIKGVEYAFRYCPPGTFTMGSPKSEKRFLSDETQRRVTLTNGFRMLETPVTQAMWKSVMGSNPSWFSSSGRGKKKVRDMNTSNFPVECVSWEDCQKFIETLNSPGLDGLKFRLPSEAEWEYACRAGTIGPYAGSSLDSLGWYCGNSGGRTHEVGTKGANPWGLCDMHGNVWEWCGDKYASYTVLRRLLDPAVFTRVLRGGSCLYLAEDSRSAKRSYAEPTRRGCDYGFRIVLVREI